VAVIPTEPEGFSRLVQGLKGGLIVSCQALPDEPLFGSHIMACMALAAQNAGAVAIRANSPVDIEAIHKAVNLPIIGLHKVDVAGYEPYITPTVAIAEAVARAGASIVAVDATGRLHPEGETSAFLRAVRSAMGALIMADISTYEEGMAAAEAGADLISTTMSGYTTYSRQSDEPDFELVRLLSRSLKVPVIAEGRIATPEQASEALDAGAYAVVVGGAITRPQQIASRFIRAINATRS
jgi:N-acylglucosamine-6-phosphate 2-epimerase